MKRLRIIINPVTGTLKTQKQLSSIIKIFSKAGYETTVYFTKEKGDGSKYCSEHLCDTELFVVCGGDGTLREAVGGLLKVAPEDRPPVGFIPSGTCNDFASSMKIPLNPIKAAKIIARGEPRYIDVGLFGKRQFMYIASFGAFTEASYSTSQQAKNLLGHLAYVLKGINSIASIKPYHAKFTVGGQSYEDDYIFCSISNSRSIAGIVKLDERLVDMSDGLFEVTLVKNPKNLNNFNSIFKAVQDKNLSSDQITLLHTDKVVFESEQVIPWTLDGEYEAGGDMVEVRNMHNAIRIVL